MLILPHLCFNSSMVFPSPTEYVQIYQHTKISHGVPSVFFVSPPPAPLQATQAETRILQLFLVYLCFHTLGITYLYSFCDLLDVPQVMLGSTFSSEIGPSREAIFNCLLP